LAPASPVLPKKDPGDGAAARIAKFIPGEVLVFYISAIGILDGLAKTEPDKAWWAWRCFLLGMAVTFCHFAFYLPKAVTRFSLLHAVVSSLAFFVWAYALGGPFQDSPQYAHWKGSILMLAFTLLSAYVPLPVMDVEPSPGDPGPDPAAPPTPGPSDAPKPAPQNLPPAAPDPARP
jgi:hypothetical protein